MGIDAVAVLPKPPNLRGETVEDPWKEGPGPGGGIGTWRELRDGVLLHLALPIETPDGDLLAAAGRWTGEPPGRVWVFPDVAVPDAETAGEIVEATQEVGRWLLSSPRSRSLLAELGLSPDEEAAYQRDMNSGDPDRVAAATARLNEQLMKRDPAEVEALMSRFLGRTS